MRILLNVDRMENPGDLNGVYRALFEYLGRGERLFRLDFNSIETAYPNVLAPLAGIIDLAKGLGADFEYDGVAPYLGRSFLSNPRTVLGLGVASVNSPMSKIWRITNSAEITRLTDLYVEHIDKSVACQKGVLLALQWCLYETMDNVLIHSNTSSGYMMGVVHYAYKRIALCIFDNGQGIFNSFRGSQHYPQTAVEAIRLAILRGVTRDSALGQGNGLLGLHSIVSINRGKIQISSDGSYYRRDFDGNVEEGSGLPKFSSSLGFTSIDFQLDYQQPIYLDTALAGGEPVNMRLESFADSNGSLIFRFADQASGTGTRQSGTKLRNRILNLHLESGQVIGLDFSGIAVVSSSFSDECIGKLVAQMGKSEFFQAFRLMNMTGLVRTVLETAVSQRVSY